MSEAFRLQGEPGGLGPRLEKEFGCLHEHSGADDLNRLLDDLSAAEVLARPKDLEILVYPSAVGESDVALITVLSTRHPTAHVVAASEEMRKLADCDLWESEDVAARTASLVEGAVGLANGAIPAVRSLEERVDARMVNASARCPSCGAENDNLSLEYRCALLGISPAGSLVLADAGQLTDIFCLSCGEEVDDVLGPDGMVLASSGGLQRA